VLSAPYLPPDRTEPLIFARYPALRGVIPWTPVAFVPTAVERCDRIAGWLGPGDVWEKRDDRTSTLYGGNKVRRFEYILAAAAHAGASHIVTVGGLASTQVTATLLFGRAAGFEVSVVLFEQPITRFLREALVTDFAAGGELVYGGGYAMTALRAIRLLARLPRPYLVLPGASNPTYNLGYVDAMLELGAQVEAGEMPRPDLIVVPAGSGGTVAGLAVGASLLGWDTEIVGVRITDLIACNRFTIGYLCEATAALLVRHVPELARRDLRPFRFSIDHRFIGPGYGYPTPEAIAAKAPVRELIGIDGEVTYSGKGLAALRRICADHPDKTILYWHTLSSVARPAGARGPLPESAGEPFQRCFAQPEVA
jgi:D-cysteine desulfhydrase